ncbi:MAG: PilN domain-containing protein [Nitrospinae bacterium]|nr:PilN domain-containing protein [Nitrospinota bacterium]
MIRINLLADRHAKDRLLIQQQVVLGSMLIVGALVLGLLWYQALSAQIDQARSDIQMAEQELSKQDAIRAEVRRMEEEKDRLENIKKAIADLTAIKAGPTLALDNVNVLLPKEMWLTAVNDTSGSMTLSGFSFSNTAVAQFMKNLEESPEFTTVALKEITQATVGQETLQQFTVTCWTILGKKLADEKARRDAEAAAAAKAAPKKKK